MSAGDLTRRDIDGAEYAFSKWGAKKSTKILIRLSKIVGKPLGLALASFQGEGKLLQRVVDTKLIGMAFEALTQNLDADEALDLIEELTAKDNVLCDNKKIVFDLHYQNRLDHMFKVLGAALEVQYGNFLGEFTAQAQTPGISNHPQT